MASPSQVFRVRLREVRRRKGWTQQQLSDALEALGYKFDASAVTRLERGQRVVTLDQVIAIAAALGVSPLHLIVPIDDDAEVDVTPGLAVQAGGARQWVRGQRPLSAEDDRLFYVQTPQHDWPAIEGTGRFKDADDYEASRIRWDREFIDQIVHG